MQSLNVPRSTAHAPRLCPLAGRPGLRPASGAFTLIELLVVIAIIALLIGILLPALGASRDAARGLKSLSNARQMGIAVVAYSTDNKGLLPVHSSSQFTGGEGRWPDHLWPYNPSFEIYQSPMLTGTDWEDFGKPFVNDPNQYFGGYGYNYQYLGNSRGEMPGFPFNARLDRQVRMPSRTIAIGDTAGSRRGNPDNRPGQGSEGVYVIDPPLTAPHGVGRSGAYYPRNSEEEPDIMDDSYLWRSFPAERNRGNVNVVFLDGHGRGMKRNEMDDSANDGAKDNGYWSGLGFEPRRHD